ncbi:outer membrane protein X [Pseudarcicella hirudinis]|uniref:Outer membrane protein X n=1 Tax=Pseudarcicella hirudinis TaxID=1079859 RepID=A0A1I5P1N3_9BACT|nr:outer membrane beta-barrel protein [Pseudarcicella hirudinis]SFP27974.1 outer membrane protein X [Pseudarcicella hirudinis]
MKHILYTLAVVFVISFSAKAQSENYHTFKVDLALGYAQPSGNGVKGGASLSLEPKYNINDQVAIGLKFESSWLSTVTDTRNDYYSGAAVGSYLLTGEYYFLESLARPFLGAGVGFYNQSSVTVIGGSATSATIGGTSFGFAPKGGFQIGHFRLVGEYNLVKDLNFFTIKAGITFGGGRK